MYFISVHLSSAADVDHHKGENVAKGRGFLQHGYIRMNKDWLYTPKAKNHLQEGIGEMG